MRLGTFLRNGMVSNKGWDRPSPFVAKPESRQGRKNAGSGMAGLRPVGKLACQRPLAPLLPAAASAAASARLLLRRGRRSAAARSRRRRLIRRLLFAIDLPHIDALVVVAQQMFGEVVRAQPRHVF